MIDNWSKIVNGPTKFYLGDTVRKTKGSPWNAG
jgi:hypothetical protein